MVGTSENIGNYKQRTVRVTPLLVCIWDCICNGSVAVGWWGKMMAQMIENYRKMHLLGFL